MTFPDRLSSARIRQVRHTDPVPVDDVPDDPAVVAERTSTLFSDRRQQELDERLLGVGQVLGT